MIVIEISCRHRKPQSVTRKGRFSFLPETAQPGKAVLHLEVVYKFARVEYVMNSGHS